MHIRTPIAAILIALVTFSGHAQATFSARVDSHNITDKDPFAFTIEATNTARMVEFSVTVTRSKRTPASPVEARLMLFDGEHEMTVDQLTPLNSTDRTYHYEFGVATNLLSYSQFVFRKLATTTAARPVVGDSFWFFLKDFASSRTPNPQGGANGRQPVHPETNRASAPAASRRSP